MDVLGWAKVAGAAAGGALAVVFAPVWLALTVLIGVMLCDFLVALVVNGRVGAWSLEQGYLGWRRKVVTLTLVIALAIAQSLFKVQTGYPLPAAEAVAGAFILLELVSVGRNALFAGVRLPKLLRQGFAKAEEEALGTAQSSADIRTPVAHE